jgi:hypothetical protein
MEKSRARQPIFCDSLVTRFLVAIVLLPMSGDCVLSGARNLVLDTSNWVYRIMSAAFGGIRQIQLILFSLPTVGLLHPFAGE